MRRKATEPFNHHLCGFTKCPAVPVRLIHPLLFTFSDKMSVFGKLFGSGGKGGKQPTPQEAIQRLRETEEMLTKKQDFLEKKIDQELMTAKKNGTKNKRGEEKPASVVV